MLDYYYGPEAEQFAFYRIPKILFEAENVSLSTDAKLLYGMIYMTYHVLNRYLLDNNLLQKIERGISWGKGNSFKKLREEMRVYLHAVKEQQNTEVKRVLTDFSKVWKFKE